jgi:hypothetical protein
VTFAGIGFRLQTFLCLGLTTFVLDLVYQLERVSMDFVFARYAIMVGLHTRGWPRLDTSPTRQRVHSGWKHPCTRWRVGLVCTTQLLIALVCRQPSIDG